ncbi:MAG: RNA-binding S4 domain-containing protein [Rhodocyclaceae bacterium]|nr:RNA-binding S4 domain-containing protein [Rhodocyclaceae bacterium]
MSQVFVVRGDFIQLDQLLKATGLCGSGGQAHEAVSSGQVLVDGNTEIRKRAKLRPGQSVRFENETVVLTAERYPRL